MKNLWKVTFDAKYTGLGDYQEQELIVTANGDGMAAVRKARRMLVGSTFEDGPFTNEKVRWITRRCRYVKLRGLELISEING